MEKNIQVILNRCSYGLYVIGSQLDGKINGQISDALMQVTAVPPRVVLSIFKGELTHDYITKSKVFSVSVLKKTTDLTLVQIFGFKSGREVNKFEKIPHTIGKTGCPLLKESIVATFEARVFSSTDVGTHTVFFGDVQEGNLIEEEEALTYGYYRNVLKASVHKNSPSYIRPLS